MIFQISYNKPALNKQRVIHFNAKQTKKNQVYLHVNIRISYIDQPLDASAICRV